jgi:RNA 3'-terminal phosphate cyclase (ATP)
MIEIDGSQGEGGGQVLRTALSLSLALRTPIRIADIRAGRARPGLLRQHLTAVHAAEAIGAAEVDGASLGSKCLTFAPRTVNAGDYSFAVGTAGSATLVLQTILPPLLTAPRRSTLALEGGTHNPWAPPYDFLERVFLPIVNRMGPRVDIALERHGFYPAGGGRFVVTIDPAPGLRRVDLVERGEIRGRHVTALVANLPRHIGDREVSTAIHLMNWSEGSGRVIEVTGAPGPGNVMFVEAQAEHVTEIATGFGETGTTAEAVANKAAHDMRRYLAAGVPVGCHLADQLLTLLAIGGGGSFRTLTLSRHARTNIDVIHAFGASRITTTDEGRDVVRVEIEQETHA